MALSCLSLAVVRIFSAFRKEQGHEKQNEENCGVYHYFISFTCNQPWSCPVEQTFRKMCSTVLSRTRWGRWCELRARRCREQCPDPRETEAGFSVSDLIGLSQQNLCISERPLTNVWDILQPCAGTVPQLGAHLSAGLCLLPYFKS